MPDKYQIARIGGEIKGNTDEQRTKDIVYSVANSHSEGQLPF
jgi:hypothetical protein